MSDEQKAVRPVPLAVPFGRQVREPGVIRGVGLSAVVHAALIWAVIWGGRRLADATRSPGPGDGPGGGGGGGGGRIFAVFALPPALPAAPEIPALRVPSLAALSVPVERPPEDVPLQISAEDLARLAGAGIGAGQGSGVGPGSGSGTGGGSGSGTGTGVGPDSGRGGGRVYPPVPQQILIPPTDRPSSVRGTTITARFEISATGEVLRVTLAPQPSDRRFASRFVEQMRRYTFTPAYTLDGRPIAAVFEIRFSL